MPLSSHQGVNVRHQVCTFNILKENGEIKQENVTYFNRKKKMSSIYTIKVDESSRDPAEVLQK